jgi:prepilin-type processing-associated H-X9-DG protein
MLAESTYSINSTRTTLTPADVADRQWNALASLYAGGALITGPAAVRNQLKGPPPSSVTGPCLPCSLLPAEMGFYWPATGTIGAANVLPPIHAGIVNVAFCDGHVDSLSNDTDCSVYDSPAVIP